MKRNQIISGRLGTLTAMVATICLMTLAPRLHAADAASDSACNDSPISSGGNGGTGFGAWTGVSTGGGGFYTAGGLTGESGSCTSSSWGMYPSGSGTVSATRPFTSADGSANLQPGQTITVDMANGGINSGGSEGLSLYNSSGATVFQFYYANGNSGWTISDNSGSTVTSVPYEGEPSAVRLIFTLTSSTTYSLKVQAPIGGTTYSFTGTLSSASPNNPEQLRFFAYNIGSGNNLEVGQISVGCPDVLAYSVQPESQAVPSGTPAVFSVEISAGDSPTYQWQTNTAGTWVNVASGGTTATFVTPATTSGMNGTQYRCVVTDACGDTTNSAAATLTVNGAVTTASISTPPSNTSTCPGSAAIFSVTDAGTSPTNIWFQSLNAGWGSGNGWVTNGGGGGVFMGSSTNNENGGSECTSFGFMDIDDSSADQSWGIYGPTETVTRSFPAALAAGQIFDISMDNGLVDTGAKNGFSLETSSGADLIQFYFLGGGTNYEYLDANGEHATAIPFTVNGLEISVFMVTTNTFTLAVTPCGGATTYFSGTNATGNIAKVKLFNNDSTGGSSKDLYFNSIIAGNAYDHAGNYSGTFAGNNAGDVAINGATNSIYSTSMATNGSVFYAIAYNSGGYAVSSTATLTINALPSATITKSGSDCQSSMDGFSVPAASGYNWTLSANTSGATFSGATNGSSVSVNNGLTGSYTINVTVTNSTGCTSNSSLTVTSVAAPTISNPSGTSACQGTTANFSVTGTGVASYQWIFSADGGSTWNDVTNGTGANTDSYTTGATTTNMNNYEYECQATGCGGATATSTAATLTVYPTAVGGTVTPTASTLCSGNSTTLNLTGSIGSIQWQQSVDSINWANVTLGSGSTTVTYTTPDLTNTTYYRAQLSSGVCSTVYSTTNSVTVSPAPVGGTATAAVTNLLSGLSTTITLSGSTGSIQWQASPDDATFTNIPGATSSTYATPALTQTTYYQAVLTNGPCSSANSTVAAVSVGTKPGYSSQPQPQSVCVGSTATFSVTASGSTPLSYSWAQHNNGGWGSGNGWNLSGSGALYLGSSTDNENGDPDCTSFSASQGDINSPNTGFAFGMYGGTGGDEVATRTFPALTTGQVVSIDVDNGGVDSGKKVGFSLQTSGGSDVLQFYFLGGGSDYQYYDATGQHDSGIGFTVTGLRVAFILDSSTNYTVNITPCGGTTVQFSGTYSGTIAQLKLFDQDTSGGAANNQYFNNFVIGGYVDNADNYSSLGTGSWGGYNFGDQPIASGNGGSTYTTPALGTPDSGSEYEAVTYNAFGTSLSTAASVTVNSPPTITLGTNPSATYGSTSASLPYTATTGSPNQYTITFDATAQGAGFTNIPVTTLPATPISIPIPSTAGVETYNGTILALNSTTGCSGSGTAFTITVNPLPVSLTGTRAYDGTTNAVAAILSVANAINGDNVTVASGTAGLAANSAGTEIITSLGSLALGGSADTNYTLIGASGSVMITQAATAITLASSENPSGYKDSVIFTAGLPSDATGSVLFLTNGVLSDTEPLSSGSATTTNGILPRGTNTIAAQYYGDSNYIGSTNTSLLQVVTNHPPVAMPMTVYRTAGSNLIVALSDIATNWSDVDGDTVELVGVNLLSTNAQTLFLLNITTNNGYFVITNTAFVGYTNGPEVNDQFSYSIADGYGGTNIGLINIVLVTNVAGQVTGIIYPGGGSVTMSFAGIPGDSYSVQRSTNLLTGSGWVTIWTTNAPAGGLFNYTDSFSGLGGVPASAYYRLSW